MIQRILNNYYKKQLKEMIEYNVKFYFIDYTFVDTDYGFCLYIKNKKYNKEEYTPIHSFKSYLYLFYISNLDKLCEEMEKNIRTYLKENNEK